LRDLREQLPVQGVLHGAQVQFAQIPQEQQTRFGASHHHLVDSLPLRGQDAGGGAGRVGEAVGERGFGQALDVFAGPLGEVGGDVVDLVFGAMAVGHGCQLLGKVLLAVVESVERKGEAVH
jgi:hypothetical protein